MRSDTAHFCHKLGARAYSHIPHRNNIKHPFVRVVIGWMRLGARIFE
jgi:hypothetical protein